MHVVNARVEHYTHYIGRPGPFGNRYSHRPSSVPGTVLVRSLGEALWRFEEDARRDMELLGRIESLPEDAVLGCWCKPSPCHGDIIVQLWKELHA